MPQEILDFWFSDEVRKLWFKSTPEFDALLRERKVFEYWYHAAVYLPMDDYRYALPRMNGMRSGEIRWQRSRDKPLMRQVLERVTSDGPPQRRPRHRHHWQPSEQFRVVMTDAG